jgi:hypothetical protein
VDKAIRHLDDVKASEKSRRSIEKGAGISQARRVDAERALREAVKRADGLLDASVALLTKLIAVEQTMERASLIGSAINARRS